MIHDAFYASRIFAAKLSADPIRITLPTSAAEYSWVNPIQVWTPGTVDFAKGEVRFKAYAVWVAAACEAAAPSTRKDAVVASGTCQRF
jgi:hypothetical protein